MDKKTIQNYRRRINAAKSSLNAMGEMLLQMDIDQMSIPVLRELSDALASGRAPLTYPYLTSRLATLEATAKAVAALDQADREAVKS
jgi:hypothetical protein